MSYIIDFYISCPMCLPEGSPKLHAEIRLAPSGCPRFDGCQACIDCYREIHRRFQSGEIDFYNDPRSVHGVFRATIQKPNRPR